MAFQEPITAEHSSSVVSRPEVRLTRQEMRAPQVGRAAGGGQQVLVMVRAA
jgi:hypothetical protein